MRLFGNSSLIFCMLDMCALRYGVCHLVVILEFSSQVLGSDIQESGLTGQDNVQVVVD
jgi:hypothetical protein